MDEKAGWGRIGTHGNGKALSPFKKSDPPTAFTVISSYSAGSYSGVSVTASNAEH